MKQNKPKVLTIHDTERLEDAALKRLIKQAKRVAITERAAERGL